jgi:hypothetical protein
MSDQVVDRSDLINEVPSPAVGSIRRFVRAFRRNCGVLIGLMIVGARS